MKVIGPRGPASLAPHGSANGLECSMPIVFNCDSEFPVFFRNFYLNLHKKTKGLFTCTVCVPVAITTTVKVYYCAIFSDGLLDGQIGIGVNLTVAVTKTGMETVRVN